MADPGGDEGLSEGTRARLEADFLATSYRVYASEGPIDLRIGQPSEALDALLERHGATTWAFISAANPHAVEAPQAVNEQRHRTLHGVLEGEGFVAIEAHGLPASARWSPEPSWFVVGIPVAHATALARCFDQVALVAGVRRACPFLVWC